MKIVPVAEMEQDNPGKLMFAAMNAIDAELHKLGFARPSTTATCKRTEQGGLRISVYLDYGESLMGEDRYLGELTDGPL